jgi:PhnB protein
MTSTLNPYLAFKDNAREAMEFYRDVLGGELSINTFGDFGNPDAPEANLVMHSQLETPAGFTLMASDTPPGMDHTPPAGISISISGGTEDADSLRGWFDQLADGGQVTMPMEKQMWGDEFGMVTDKFGVGWMVDVVQPAGADNPGGAS